MRSVPNEVFSDFVRLQNEGHWHFRLYVRYGNSSFIESWFPSSMEYHPYLDHEITIFSPSLPDTSNTGCRDKDCEDAYELNFTDQKEATDERLDKKYMEIKATVSHKKRGIKDQAIIILIYEPYELTEVPKRLKPPLWSHP